MSSWVTTDGKIAIKPSGVMWDCDDCPCGCQSLPTSFLVKLIDPSPVVSAQGVVTLVPCGSIVPPIASCHGYCSGSQAQKCYWVGACTSGADCGLLHAALLLRHVSITGSVAAWSVEAWDDVFCPANEQVGFAVAAGTSPVGTWVKDANTWFEIS